MEAILADKQNDDRTWQKIVLKYARPDHKKSIWQILNSLVPYLFLWVLMYISLDYSYVVTLFLSLLASGFLIRIFIIFHDCGHGSFFKSMKTNKIVGMIMGILAFTPYNIWHHHHAIHHATAGNLDKRGIGDVWTMTVEEYRNSSSGRRFVYRAFRNPFIMFTVGPLFMILIKNRFSRKDMTRKEKLNIYFTNLAILLMAVGTSLLIGIKAYLLIQIPVIFLSHSIGIWLFYVQHQFDDVLWKRGDEWEYKTAAIAGSSYLKLPSVIQWFTGNIGFHHVHHLSSRIPNYNLESCHHENEIFREVTPVTFLSTFKALYLNLYDEVEQRLTSFRRVRITAS